MTTTDDRGAPRLGEASPPPPPAPRGAPRLVLAFDTGSPITSVALARGGEVLTQEAAERASRSDSILALIDAVLTRCGAAPRDLDALCVLRGPGSFTGLRIGLASALGLHQALGVAVAAMPTLHVLAEAGLEACDAPVGRVIAVVDALRGEWFAQVFARRGGLDGPLEPEGPPEIVNAAALVAAPLAAASLAPIALVGFGVSAIVPGVRAGLVAIDSPLLAPVAARLA